MNYSLYKSMSIPFSSDGKYSEDQILRLLLEWIEDRHPYLLRELSENSEGEIEKEFARKILFLRLQAEPEWLYLLPESLLIKIGVQIDQAYVPDLKVKSLMEAIKTSKVKRLNFEGFKNPTNISNNRG